MVHVPGVDAERHACRTNTRGVHRRHRNQKCHNCRVCYTKMSPSAMPATRTKGTTPTQCHKFIISKPRLPHGMKERDSRHTKSSWTPQNVTLTILNGRACHQPRKHPRHSSNRAWPHRSQPSAKCQACHAEWKPMPPNVTSQTTAAPAHWESSAPPPGPADC